MNGSPRTPIRRAVRLMGAVTVMAALALSGSQYQPALPLVLASFGPLALVEGIVTGAAVVLIRQVKPELLGFAGPAHG